MVIKFLIFLSIALSACNSKKNEDDSNVKDIRTNYSTNYVKLIEFKGRDSLEINVVNKIRRYLKDEKLDEKCFYIGEIGYPSNSENLGIANEYNLLIELIHWKTVTYFDSIYNINKDISENKELNEIYIPMTGNISGEDRYFYYYKETDVMDVMLMQ